METYLDEYRTNSDPICQFVDSYIEETDENGFVPVQTMLDAVRVAQCRFSDLFHTISVVLYWA